MAAQRQRGRPRRGAEPAFDAALVDRLLVEGELAEDHDCGERRTYPSYREVAARVGVAPSLIARYARQHDCLGRRRRAGQGREEPRGAAARPRPEDDELVPFERRVRFTARAFAFYERMLDEGRLRPEDAPAIERLLKTIEEQDAARRALTSGLPDGVPTLEVLQRLHAERQAAHERADAALRGEVIAPACAGEADARG